MSTHPLTTPYSSTTFHASPHIDTAASTFETQNGKSFIDKILAPLIRKHTVEECFGPTLVHRHFDIEADEKLVEFNNVTTPWTIDEEFQDTNVGSNGLIYPTAWLLDAEGKWMAYEFAFSPTGGKDKHIVDFNAAKYHDFLLEYALAIKAGGWEKVLGLRAWPGDGFAGVLEFTQGKANINLTPAEFDLARAQEGRMRFVETMWFFCKGFLEHPIYGRCVGWCPRTAFGTHTGWRGHRRPQPNPGGDLVGYPAARK